MGETPYDMRIETEVTMQMISKFVTRVSLLIVFMFVFAACAPVQGFVQLPAEQQAAITGLFIALFALGFDWLIGFAPWLEWFRQYREPWAIAASLAFTTWLQNILPTGFEDISIKGVGFILAIFAAVIPYLVVRKILARRGVRGFVG